MRLIAMLFAVLATTGAGLLRPYYASKSEMIARSEVIALVDVQHVAAAQAKGSHWTYGQRADAVTVQVIKGELPRRVHLYAQENFVCTRIDFRPGRYLVFLRRDGTLWSGSNWYLSARRIDAGATEWYAQDRQSGDRPSRIVLVSRALEDVVADVRSVVARMHGAAAEQGAAGDVRPGIAPE